MDSVEKIVDHITGTQFDDLSEPVVDNAKRFILDSLGVAIAGSSAPGCKEVVELVKLWEGKPEATVLMYGGKIPSPSAAMVNSIMMHALDFDDTLDESALHAHVSVLPAAVAVAESVGKVSGADLINAVTLGVDVVCRLGLATKRPLSWIRTATCGSFGAAAAAGKVMRLNKEQMVHALGVVYSQTSGNAQCLVDGGLVKRMQPAFSARAGVLSAFLAQRGITGARHFLEGQYGFFNLYEGGDYDRQKLLDDLGNRFEGMKLSIKPYPSCRMTHASIDAVLAIREAHEIEPSEIEEIVLHVSKMVHDMVGSEFTIRDNPQVDAQFSIPYTVAAGLLRGDVFLEDFEEASIRDPRLLKLTEKVKVVVDPELGERDIMTARLVLKANGKVYSQVTKAMKGNPLNPMTMDDCTEKFKKCVLYSQKPLAEERVDEILDCLVKLEALKDVTKLMGLLS
jgi:2-methylcitrate dehydratase PrpD